MFGLALFIFIFYVPKNKKAFYNKIRWYVMCISASYILLTVATIITAFRGIYSFGNFWYFLVTIAYLLGDVGLIILLKFTIHQRIKEYYEKL
ncbi:MAG: hypothetical protein C4308_14200 [Chitinophagaceae bacterium]